MVHALAALTLHLFVGQVDDAVTAYEAGDAERCLQILDRVEKTKRATPLTASLRAYANEDLNRPKEAHKAVFAYLAMVAHDPPNTEAHRDLVEMEKRLNKQLSSEWSSQLHAINNGAEEELKRAEEAAEVQAKKLTADAEAELKVRRKAAAQRDILQDAAELYLEKTAKKPE